MNILEPVIQVLGSVMITRILDRNGNPLPASSICDWARDDVPSVERPLALGDNLVVNLGRVAIVNLLGSGLSGGPSAASWSIQKVSFGTGSDVPKYSDASLSPQTGGTYLGGENEVILTGTDTKKAIDSVEFPGSFLVRFMFALDYPEANMQTIREAALWTGGTIPTMFARKVFPGIQKSGDRRIEFAWVIRS